MRQDENIGKGNAGAASGSEDGEQVEKGGSGTVGSDTDEEIKSAILSVMKKRISVRSQEELASLVADEINDNVQPQKIRILALELPQVDVRVLTKKSNREKPSNCPSCSKPLKALYAKNLLDQKVIVGLECGRCLYRGTLKSFAPFRYEFSIKQKSF